MYIIADQRIPGQAKEKLNSYGEVLWLEPQEVTYSAISAHPDIFFCLVNDHLVVAPNISEEMKIKLKRLEGVCLEGEQSVENSYPVTAGYNSVVTSEYIIGNTRFTDRRIKEQAESREIIHVNQGYTRCNLIPLPDNRFITSDKGIEKKLLEYDLEILFVEPTGILLPGFKHGFIGGTCGVWKDNLFFIGSLKRFPEGEKIRNFVHNMEIIELYNGPLFDGGSLIFF
jgi:hypothetical protein